MSMPLDISSILSELAGSRPIFHSEADFQHAFALALTKHASSVSVRLEVPFSFDKPGATDIVARSGGSTSGIELKYLTRQLAFKSDGETFNLKAQGATVLRRYDVLKDVQRLERFNEQHGGPSHVVVVTNDPAYWNPSKRRCTIDSDFRLCEGRVVSGLCRWAETASPGSMRNREEPINLHGSYMIRWQPYANLEVKNGEFRYLHISIALRPGVLTSTGACPLSFAR
jgi:hypothetical protein